MSTAGITLERCEQAERDLAHDEARAGLTVHAIVTVVVAVMLVVINLTVAASSRGRRSPLAAWPSASLHTGGSGSRSSTTS